MIDLSLKGRSFLYYNKGMIVFNEQEKHALRYYEGILDRTETDPFFLDAKAYVTFNSLFFDGIETETARSQEDRRLNPLIACDHQKFLSLAGDLYCSCLKYEHDTLHVYRVERLVDYQKFCAAGMLTSFISTSRSGFLPFYEDKHDLVLMDIVIEKDVPCVDLVDVLDYNEKKEEAEVLIAPYAAIEVQEECLPASLAAIKDGQGKSPAVYCHVHVRRGELHTCREEPFTKGDRASVNAVYSALNMHAMPEDVDTYLYNAYKQKLHARIWSMMERMDH